MPDWSNYFLCFNAGTSASSNTASYEEWKQECERQDRMMEQQREIEELRKDKVRYPLFFLKEGIV